MSSSLMDPFDTDDFVIDVAKQAGEIIKEDYLLHNTEVSFKISSADLVTKTDVLVENYILKHIRSKYPHHVFLCEESSHCERLTDSPTWVIDPVDGTMNFVKRIPFLAVSIGFTCNKKVYLGVIYNPIQDELFYAVRGQGAFLIQRASTPIAIKQKLNVNIPKSLSEMVIATGFSVSLLRKGLEDAHLSAETAAQLEEVRNIVFKNTENLLLHCRDLRRTGSCACDMAYVASGRFDALIEMNVKEWDVCAGVVIIEEAGGVVTNYNASKPLDIGERNILATVSNDFAQQLSKIISTPSFDPRLFG